MPEFEKQQGCPATTQRGHYITLYIRNPCLAHQDWQRGNEHPDGRPSDHDFGE